MANLWFPDLFHLFQLYWQLWGILIRSHVPMWGAGWKSAAPALRTAATQGESRPEARHLWWDFYPNVNPELKTTWAVLLEEYGGIPFSSNSSLFDPQKNVNRGLWIQVSSLLELDGTEEMFPLTQVSATRSCSKPRRRQGLTKMRDNPGTFMDKMMIYDIHCLP